MGGTGQQKPPTSPLVIPAKAGTQQTIPLDL